MTALPDTFSVLPSDQGDSFGSGDMRVLPELPTPSCQTSIVNAGCSSAKPECAAGGDKMLISAPWGTTRQNMTLSAGEFSRRFWKAHSCRAETSSSSVGIVVLSADASRLPWKVCRGLFLLA